MGSRHSRSQQTSKPVKSNSVSSNGSNEGVEIRSEVTNIERRPVVAEADRSKTHIADDHAVSVNGPVAVTQNVSMEETTGGNQFTMPSLTGHTDPAIVDDLHQQIEGKNELIAALVAELEQVVEQLDRVKRNGTDRSRGSSTAQGLPPEVVEEHQQVLGELQRFVQQWEEMQAASALVRIEAELSELRSMMSSGYRADVPAGSAVNLELVMSRLTVESTTVEPAPSQSSNWEAMKRQMLGEPEQVAEEPTVEDDLSVLLAGIAIPSPIDFDSASAEALKRACAERDTYIVQMTRWVRTHRAVNVPENWEELQGVPDELQRQVAHLSSRLEEQVRLAEVEMSLERARLSREKSQVQADRAIMEKHLKRLGITSLDELEDIAVSSSSTGDRRWMRFLGVNRKG